MEPFSVWVTLLGRVVLEATATFRRDVERASEYHHELRSLAEDKPNGGLMRFDLLLPGISTAARQDLSDGSAVMARNVVQNPPLGAPHRGQVGYGTVSCRWCLGFQGYFDHGPR